MQAIVVVREYVTVTSPVHVCVLSVCRCFITLTTFTSLQSDLISSTPSFSRVFRRFLADSISNCGKLHRYRTFSSNNDAYNTYAHCTFYQLSSFDHIIFYLQIVQLNLSNFDGFFLTRFIVLRLSRTLGISSAQSV